MTDTTPAACIALSFTFSEDETVAVDVTGYARGVTALRTLTKTSDPQMLEQMARALALRPATDARNPVVIEMAHGDDQATVTVTGFTDPEFALHALAQAGSAETFARLVDVLSGEGDMSLLELMDDNE